VRSEYLILVRIGHTEVPNVVITESRTLWMVRTLSPIANPIQGARVGLDAHVSAQGAKGV
jgi:hypothetical protein